VISRPSPTILMLSAVCLQTGTAVAHPHVWVTMMSELIYAADGWAWPRPFSTRAPRP
jgi:ABC-type uncharacterized transport system substrate-binding protein